MDTENMVFFDIDDETEARFWSKVDKSGDCWIWTGSINRYGGYGQFWDGKRSHNAHRYAYILVHNIIPPGLVVMHACDNPAYVNPAHLSLGTYKDNTMDMMRKGRHTTVPRGKREA